MDALTAVKHKKQKQKQRKKVNKNHSTIYLRGKLLDLSSLFCRFLEEIDLQEEM